MELCNNLVNPLFIRKQKQNTQFSPVSLRIAWLEDWESKVLQLLLHFFDSVFQFFRRKIFSHTVHFYRETKRC